MKGYVYTKLRYCFSVLFFVCFFTVSGESFSLHFDNLFPSSVYEQTLNACMQLWGEVNAFSSCKHQREDAELLNDVIIGKLFYINTCIKQMSVKHLYKNIEDIEYLRCIIDKVVARYKKIVANQDVDPLKKKSIEQLISQITGHMSDLF